MPLTSSQWGICLLAPAVYLVVAELGKLVDRRSDTGAAALAMAEGTVPG